MASFFKKMDDVTISLLCDAAKFYANVCVEFNQGQRAKKGHRNGGFAEKGKDAFNRPLNEAKNRKARLRLLAIEFRPCSPSFVRWPGKAREKLFVVAP